jgi:hypothetical protein
VISSMGLLDRHLAVVEMRTFAFQRGISAVDLASLVEAGQR